jgi:hypothetical protein
MHIEAVYRGLDGTGISDLNTERRPTRAACSNRSHQEDAMRNLEYCMLHDVKPVGRSVGFYADREIPESVIDQFGRRFDYVGVATRKPNGQLDGDALGTGEFILRPGLVYRLVRAIEKSPVSTL